nr:ycbM [Bacillus subtilis]
MTVLWVAAVIALACLNVIQFIMKKKRDGNLAYTADQLSYMLSRDSAGQILLPTDDHALKDLLVNINLIVENRQQIRIDERLIAITVWDRGKGISETDQQRVFERLYTLEESRNKAFQGSGLGLTITKRLTEKMGGIISVQSKPYERTAFTITLKRMTY